MVTCAGAFHLLPSHCVNTTCIQLNSTLEECSGVYVPGFMLLLSAGEEEGCIAFSHLAIVYPETVTVTYGNTLQREETLPSFVVETVYLYSTYKSGALRGASQSIFMSATLEASSSLQLSTAWRTSTY